MGNHNSAVTYHGSLHSPGVQLADGQATATFPPYARDCVSYLGRSISRMTREREFCVKFQAEFAKSATLGVGFRSRQVMDGAPLAGDTDVTIWNLTAGTLVVRGGVKHGVSLPNCGSGAVCYCTINTGTRVVSCTVHNQGVDPETREVVVDSLPHEIWPFIVVLSNGSEAATVRLIPFNQQGEQVDHLLDLTAEAAFDASTARGALKVSENGKVVQRSSDQQGNACVLMNRVMSRGKHHWTLDVKVDFGASICLGLARSPFEFSKEYQDDGNRYIYRHQQLLLWRSYRGLLYQDGIQLDHTLEPLGWQHKRRVRVDFRLDLDTGTLEVIRNGQNLGIAFKGISGPVQPIVAFYASYEKEVELIQYRTSQDNAPMTLPCAQNDVLQAPCLDSTVVFNSALKYGDLGVSEDGTSIFRNKTQLGNAYCPLSVCCSSGGYHFSFVIENDRGASTCVGVAKGDIRFNVSGNIYQSKDMYLYRSYQGMLYSDGKELNKRLEEFWSSGTLVEMIVDLKGGEGTVQFVVNGVDQGVAFTGLRPPLIPLICFYSGMEKRVTLLHYEHTLGPQNPPSVLKYPDMNKLTEAGSRPPYCAPLPAMATPSHATYNSPKCLHVSADRACDKPVILLPCKHAILCPTHARPGRLCPKCNTVIEGSWNVLQWQ